MSEENSSGLPSTCSGLAYSGVNANTPVLVMELSPLASTNRAVPKSRSLAFPEDTCKIVHLQKHKVAYAGVGDSVTRDVGRELSAILDSDGFDFGYIAGSLEQVAKDVVNRAKAETKPPDVFDDDRPRSLLIVFYGDQITNRQLWHLTIHSRGTFRNASIVPGMTISGAIGNGARFFGSYFRRAAVGELTLLAAHTVLMAHRFDNLMIDGLDVALFDDGGYHLFNEEEKDSLRERSQALDESIHSHLFSAPATRHDVPISRVAP